MDASAVAPGSWQASTSIAALDAANGAARAMNDISSDTVGLLRRELRDVRAVAQNVDTRVRQRGPL